MRPATLLLTGILMVAALLGIAPPAAFGQAATPAGPARSLTRDEARQHIFAALPMEEPRNRGGQLIYGMPADVSTLNPHLVADVYSLAVTAAVYEPLVKISPVDGRPIPGLADWWEVAPDGVTYTFHLNEDARFHDGQDVTADDVVFSFDAMLDEQIAAAFQSLVAPALASYRAVDADTIELVSNGPLAAFLWDVPYSVPIVPKHLWADVPPDRWASDPGSTGEDPSRVVGTGPFRLVEWVPGDHATLVRNEDYYDGDPVIDEYVVAVYPDDVATVQALKTGEVDVIDYVPTALIADLQGAGGVEIDSVDSSLFEFYLPNLDPEKTTLFQDKRVREALFVALDRPALVEAAYLGYAVAARGTQPTISFAYAPDRIAPAYDHDPGRARELLAAAGWTDTNGDGTVDKDGQEFAFEILFDAGNTAEKQLLAPMQDQWRAIGVAMTPKPVPFPTLMDALTVNHDFEMIQIGFIQDPSGGQGFLFRCDAYPTGANGTKYCNPEYDRIDDQQRSEHDPAERRELLIRLSNIVWGDLPIGVIAFPDNPVGYQSRVHNLHPTGWGGATWAVQYVWVDA